MRSKWLHSMTFCASLTVLCHVSVAQETEQPLGVEVTLPPGWTPADMQACIEAATPGDQQQLLAKDVGTWKGKTQMWMMPGADPVSSECTTKVTSLLDGRYIRIEMEGDMPGMGPYKGSGTAGFDNVSKTFQATWIDNQSTGIMMGTGELSDDKKTMTWEYKYSCPITKKSTPFRQVETVTGPNSKRLEMYTVEPKSGEEYKLMQIDMTRES